MVRHLSSVLGKIFFVILHKKSSQNLCNLLVVLKTCRSNPKRQAEKPDYKQIGLKWDMGIFQSPFLFGNLSGPDIVSIIISVKPFCGLITQIGVFLDKPTDMAPGCSGIQTIDLQPTIFNSGDDCVVRPKSNAALDFKNTTISVGMRIKFFHFVHFLSFWMY
jgi:hypothetical protein